MSVESRLPVYSWHFTSTGDLANPQGAIENLKQADVLRTGSITELVQTVPVRAPAAGSIASFRVVPGQIVHPEEPLFEIQDLTRVWVKGFVYESDANRVRLGQTVHLRFTAYPELEACGTLVRISPVMHESMRARQFH